MKGSRAVQVDARKRNFLDKFRKTGNVSQACRSAGIESRATAYRWFNEDDEFAQAWQIAEQESIDRLEEAARIRAEEGTVDYVVSQGRLVYIDDPENPGKKIPLQKRQYSDQLLITLLKAHRPEKYREKVEHSGPGNGPVRFTLNITPIQLDDHDQAIAGPTIKAIPPQNGEDPQATAQGSDEATGS